MPALLWFRRDLRLHDLPAALDAAKADGGGGEVLACYVLDPRLHTTSGARRLRYLHDALQDLRDGLDGRLLVTTGRPEQRIPDIAKRIEATSVHVSEDFTPFGMRRDEAVREALAKVGDGVPLEASGSPYLVSPGRVTKDDGSAYKVFTPFFRAWKEHGWRAPAKTGPKTASWIDPASVDGVRNEDIEDVDVDIDVTAGETGARKAWKAFVADRLDDYADDRNRPDVDGISRMSAHLKFGAIHPRTMAADLGRGKGAQAYLRELCFRDFYANVVREWPRSTWWNFNSAFDAMEVDDDAAAKKRFETWKAGKTGYPIVDAGMRQLSQSGWMHNRVRMITASFLVKDLHLPWQWGARWFLDQLVDGDMANNQHGWQWAAGTGTDASPFFRVFNPITQGDKFDPDGAYVRQWVPEYGTDDYPEPMVDHKTERAEALRRYEQIR